MFCPACGVQLPKISKFCLNCGVNLSSASAPAPARTPSTPLPTIKPAASVDLAHLLKAVRARYARLAASKAGQKPAALTAEDELALTTLVKKLPAAFTPGFWTYWELPEPANALPLVVLGLAPFLLQSAAKSRLIYLAADSDTLREGWELAQGVSVAVDFAAWEDVGTAIYQRQANENAWILGDLDWRGDAQDRKSMRALMKAAVDQRNTAAIFFHQIGKIAAVELPIRL